MSTRLSEQLDRIFVSLERAQAGHAPSDMPSYSWQGRHLSLTTEKVDIACDESPSAATLDPVNGGRR